MSNIFIVGHGRSGKDTLGDIFVKELGLKFMSSSQFLCDQAVYPILKDKYGYKTSVECYERRHEEGIRKQWFDIITAYNKPDRTRLATALFNEYDMYVGIRNQEELHACKEKGLVDLVIWVDSSERLPDEATDSMTVTIEDADIVITNNESLELFEYKGKRLAEKLKVNL